ncbi:putative diguanylate cyclase YcdT [compost metagenome]
MRFSPMFRVDLRRLILLLSITAALLTLINSFYVGYQVQRDLLIQQTLEANRVYAAKLAESTEGLLASARQQLAYSAARLPALLEQPQQLAAETERLKQQTDTFNSAYIVRDDLTLLAISPAMLLPAGSLLNSAGARESLEKRQPLVSAPFVSTAGKLVVMISQPIIAADGRYLGYVGGSIYLRERSILNSLLGEHFYRDGSYIYVVDQRGQLLYHRDAERVGEPIHSNPAVAAVIAGQAGSQQIVNSRDIDMLAGYAPVASTGWGIVAQRPTANTLAELDGLMLSILRNALPFSLLSLLGIWWLARLIAQPLWQLASSARQMDSQTAPGEIRQVGAWYFEAAELKRALIAGLAQFDRKIGKLNLDTLTDPLTGLYNRRGLQLTLEQWQARTQPFAAVALDIDHFKQVNDNHGHAVGDLQLQHLARLMREGSRGGDVLCRVGGEEFLILLPDVDLATATQVAERLRLRMETCTALPCGPVTLSIGVAHWPDSAAAIDRVLEMADQALYTAKRSGRNLVVVAPSERQPSDASLS